MKISIDDIELMTLTPTQENIIKNEINADEFEADLKRRIVYIVQHKIDQCRDRLKSEWVDNGKLAANGVVSMPLNDNDLADLIFAQPDYLDRKAKDALLIA